MGGTIGNNNAGEGRTIRDALRYELAKLGRQIEGDEAALKKGMRAVAAPVVAAAADGDMSAFKEVADRLDGKAPQAIDIDGQLSVPLSGTVKLVKCRRED